MKSKEGKLVSIKLNFVLSALRVFSTALITLATIPYLNRVLGVENIGKIEYIYTVITYFVLFSSIGIPMYGIREVSKKRHDSKKLYALVLELLIILLITTFISYILIFGIVLQIGYFHSYKNLIYIMSFMVILNNIGAEWYFQGMENQKFITVRHIFIRVTILVLIFIMIKKNSDYEKYAVLFVIMLYGANIINFITILRKIISHDIKYKDLDIKRHLRPVFAIFIATVSVNIYLQLDIFLLGSIAGDRYVAYYTLANKLIRYIITFITIIGSVMLPRLSYLYLNDKIQYNRLLKKAFDIMMLLAIPSTIYFFVFSKQIILFMGGADFIVADLTIKILSPLCIIVSFAYFFGFLILYPQGKEKIYTVATIISALVSIALNFYAIKNFQHNGAAVVALIAEAIAIFIMLYFIKKDYSLRTFFDNNFFKIILVNTAVAVTVLILKNFILIDEDNFVWIYMSLMFIVLYIVILLGVREKNMIEMLVRLVPKWQYRKNKS